MRLLCFFGSGISRPSGMPMTGEITKAVLNPKTAISQQELLALVPNGGRPGHNNNLVRLIQDFLRHLNCTAEVYLKMHSGANGGNRDRILADYEHLFAMSGVIKADAAGRLFDPAYADFVGRIRWETKHLYEHIQADHSPWGSTGFSPLEALARYSQIFIECVVRDQLTPPRTPKGFTALRDLIAKHQADFVTLNHDLILEEVLGPGNYSDGFTRRDGQVRFYDDEAFANSNLVRLLKPHGSINWYNYPEHVGGYLHDRYAIPDGDPDRVTNNRGARLENLRGYPAFLTGINKSPRYERGIFGKQVAWFRRCLSETRRIVCSGYGWKDEGMNNLLFEWLYADRQHRLVLLHDAKRIEQDLLIPPSPWLHHYHELQTSGQLKVIPKWLCCCKDASEIISALN